MAIESLELPDFLPAALCTALRAAMIEAPGAPASLIGEGDDRPVRPLMRRTTQVDIPAPLRQAVARRLDEATPTLAAHFGAPLGACEPPQFLRYQAGDYFVAHQDGNTPLIHDRSRLRRVSVTLFLNPQSPSASGGAYAGGDFVFHGPYPDFERTPLAPPPGTLLAFRAETTHEVLPVTAGLRLTIAAWYPTADLTEAVAATPAHG